jgi:hypothetical protein
MSKYEVQTFCICGGWQNVWHITEADGTERPETFETKHEATSALVEFLEDIQNEINAGHRQPDEGYSREEFRVVKISNSPKGV